MENDFPTARYVPPYMQPFMQGLKQLCASREDADVLIRCGSSEWKAHKAIVCAQWPFVDKALRDYKEGREGVIELKEDDPKAVGGLIEYLYNFDYDVNGASSLFEIQMFIIADKYLIQPLADLAMRKFETKCRKDWSTSDFACTVYELYTCGMSCTGMKKIAIKFVHEHADVLLDEQRQNEFAQLHEVLETTALGADVARVRFARDELRSRSKNYRCSGCGALFTIEIPTGSTVTCPKMFCHALLEETRAVFREAELD